MDKKHKKLSVVLGISGVLFVIGFLFIFGVLTQSEVHLFTHEFEYQGEFALLTLRFESKTGVFTVGQEIDINAFLTTSHFTSQDNKIHLLYFPNSFTPDEYKKLLQKENFAKIIPDEDGSGFTFEVAPSKIFLNLGNFPPQTETSAVWTQDGPKNAILLMDAKSIAFTDKDIEEQGVLIENIITIQPSDVKVQMQSNNITTGLALIITGITIIVGLFGLENLLITKDDTKRKK